MNNLNPKTKIMSRGSHSGPAGTIYLNIGGGNIVERVEPDHPHAKKRTNKNGKEVYERLDDYVEGVITAMWERTKEFSGEEVTELCVRLQSGDETYQLGMNQGDRYWVALSMRLPNLDLSRPVKFRPYSFTDKEDGRVVTGMNLFQGDTKIAPKFTKEDPGKMPPAEKVMYQGKERYDFFKRDAFLRNVVSYFADRLRKEEEAIAGSNVEDDTPTATNDPQPQYGRPEPQPAQDLPPSMRPPQQYPEPTGRGGKNPNPIKPVEQQAEPKAEPKHIPDQPGTWDGQDPPF